MKTHFSILCLIIVLAILKKSLSYPSGAPLDRCASMMPGHDSEPIKTSPPYQITVNPISSNEFNVTLSTTEEKGFKGFLLEARGRWDGRSLGKWSTDVRKTKTINCFDFENSAVTHFIEDDSNLESSHFKSVSFRWTRPKSDKLNRVKFMATVVKKFKEIYMNVSTTIKLKDLKLAQITNL